MFRLLYAAANRILRGIGVTGVVLSLMHTSESHSDVEGDAPDREAFPVTSWSEVARAWDLDAKVAFRALSALVERYRRPLEAHVERNCRVALEQAQDWLQGFLHEKVVRDRLLRHARQGRGRFRTFLLNALDNYVISEMRKAGAQKRRPAGGMECLDEVAESRLPASAPDLDERFDVDWAREVIAETLRRMETECQGKGEFSRWEVFRARVIEPSLDGRPKPPYEEIVERCRFASPAEAYNALTTAVRRFRRLLADVVHEYEQDPKLAEEEIEELHRSLERAGTPRAGWQRPGHGPAVGGAAPSGTGRPD